jgi:hypothetical protein
MQSAKAKEIQFSSLASIDISLILCQVPPPIFVHARPSVHPSTYLVIHQNVDSPHNDNLTKENVDTSREARDARQLTWGAQMFMALRKPMCRYVSTEWMIL